MEALFDDDLFHELESAKLTADEIIKRSKSFVVFGLCDDGYIDYMSCEKNSTMVERLGMMQQIKIYLDNRIKDIQEISKDEEEKEK